MKLSNKVKNALQRFVEKEVYELKEDDGYHKINITEPDLGHIVIDVKEYRKEVVDSEEANVRTVKEIYKRTR